MCDFNNMVRFAITQIYTACPSSLTDIMLTAVGDYILRDDIVAVIETDKVGQVHVVAVSAISHSFLFIFVCLFAL